MKMLEKKGTENAGLDLGSLGSREALIKHY